MKWAGVFLVVFTLLLVVVNLNQGLRYYYLDDYFSWFFVESDGVEQDPIVSSGTESELEEIVVTGSRINSAPSPIMQFWIKLVFSTVLGGCSLFVVMSKKYDEQTTKWAFSVLSMVSGVWIGTVT